ncbi:hypothetical protein [Blautia marasmi]|uniref:hypothetical protein n=1 Tax=Blautia marasmi TaxID=1917868 RepID=UPI000CF20A92|nr:hypothetical protein [Blautia marasmi]
MKQKRRGCKTCIRTTLLGISVMAFSMGNPVYAAETEQETNTNAGVLQEQQGNIESPTDEDPSEQEKNIGTSEEKEPESLDQNGKKEDDVIGEAGIVTGEAGIVTEDTDKALSPDNRNVSEAQQNPNPQIFALNDLTVNPQNGWAYDKNVLTFSSSGDYTVTGTTTRDRIVVAPDFEGSITIEDLTINTSSGAALLVDPSAKLTLKLSGINTLNTANVSNAGLDFSNVTSGYLIITSAAGDGISDGSLTATGGTNGAGVGGGSNGYAGNITINGGTITAEGGTNGAGIGGGSNGYACNITINGGTITAKGQTSGAGVGGGSNGDVCNITINGGSITAEGGINGAGIGGGSGGSADSISITGGIVKAYGTISGAGIGGGANGNCTFATITGGTVEASNRNGRKGIDGGSNGSAKNTVITGGSIKGPVSGSPTDGNGNYVYKAILENQPGITSVNVDGMDYKVAGNHENDDSYYLYMTGRDHVINTPQSRYIGEFAASKITISELLENMYTLTIPASLELGSMHEADISVSRVYMTLPDMGKQVKVKVSDSTKISQEGVLALSRTGGSAEVFTSVSNESGPLTTGIEILSVSDRGSDSRKIYFGDPAASAGSSTVPAGNYSGTLTFAVSVE